jgi:carbonic anhydrase
MINDTSEAAASGLGPVRAMLREAGCGAIAERVKVADIATFVAGFERFQEKYFAGDDSVYTRLRQGQKPHALVISCCDSRADPGMLMGAGPGDIFVVRNVANLVPPYRNEAEMPGIRADIEFAVKSLNVEHIIILGHSGCGGIRALMDGEGVTKSNFEFIGAWVNIASAARERVMRELAGESDAVKARACERWAIALSLDNLLSFPWIGDRVEAGTLALHGWYFDIDAGELLAYSRETSSFAPLVAKTAAVQTDGARA